MSVPQRIPLLKEIKIRREVLEGEYQPAINIVDIDSGSAPGFLRDPVEFFKRTAVTPGVKELVVKVLMSLLNLREARVGGTAYSIVSKLFVLPSLFGGGKSHALATVYHVVRVISSSRDPDEAFGKLAVLDEDIAKFVREHWQKLASLKPKVVVMHGSYSNYAPTPLDGKPAKTLWGYLADKLGEYPLVSEHDKSVVTPPVDVLEKVLSGKGVVVLIDEIAYYYSRIPKEMRETVNSFLMGLSELLGGKEVSSTAVVITLPYSYEKDVVEKAHTGLLDASTIKRIFDRTRVNLLIVTAPEDLATIVRKRIFDEVPAELEKIGSVVAKEILRGVPAESVKDALKSFGLENELPKTYPVHPETIKTLKVLHLYLSEFLQLTRSPLAMIADAVRAVRSGCFDWMGFEPHLLMPYHIPVFDEQVLVSSLPATEKEFYRFRYVLEDSVVKPSQAGLEKCVVKPSTGNYVSEGYVAPAYAMSVYIWLRSLAGRGLVSNMDIYPKAKQVAFAVLDLPVARDDKWYDAETTLTREIEKLPHIRSVSDKWFFKWTPKVRELVERYADKVTDSEVESKLEELLRNSFTSSKTGGVVFRERPDEMLFFNTVEGAGGRHASVVVYTRPVSRQELLEQVKYNNVVVMPPDTESQIPAEEVKRLAIPHVDTYWKALISVLKYQIACEEKLTQGEIEKEFEEEIREDKELEKSLLNQLNNMKKAYAGRARELVGRVYREVKLRRGNKIISIPLKGLTREPPSFQAIEDDLLDRYVLSAVDESWIINLAQKLNLDPNAQGGIPLISVWQYLLTGDDENVPVVSLDWFARNALQPAKTLEYGVVVKGRLYWKKVFQSKEKALTHLQSTTKKVDEMSDEDYWSLVREVVKSVSQGEEVFLVHHKHIWRKWLDEAVKDLKDEILMLTNGGQDFILDPKQLQAKPLADFMVKSYVVFKEKVRVKVDVSAPEYVDPDTPVRVEIALSSATVSQARLKVAVSGVKAEPLEKLVTIPHAETVTLEQEEGAREITIAVSVEDVQGATVLGRGEALVRVRRPKEEVEIAEEVLTVSEARDLVAKGFVASIKELEISQLGDYNKSLPVLKAVGGEVLIRARFERLDIETSGGLNIEEAGEVVNTVLSLKERFKLNELLIKVKMPEEKAGSVNVIKELPENVRVKVLIKKHLR